MTSSKLRYVETGGRGARGGRGGTVASSQDAQASNLADASDGMNGDGKNQDGKQAKENVEAFLQSQDGVQVTATEDRKRQDGSLWSESGTLSPCTQLVEGNLKGNAVVRWVVV